MPANIQAIILEKQHFFFLILITRSEPIIRHKDITTTLPTKSKYAKAQDVTNSEKRSAVEGLMVDIFIFYLLS